MKVRTKLIFGGLLVTALVIIGHNRQARKNREQIELQERVKISRAQAQRAALAQMPGGVIRAGELKAENGRLVWSFEISPADSPGIIGTALDALTGGSAENSPADADTEIAVNAFTGSIVPGEPQKD